MKKIPNMAKELLTKTDDKTTKWYRQTKNQNNKQQL